MADSNSQNSGVKRSATASPSRNDGGAHDANHASSQNQESSENQKKHMGRPRVGSHHPIAVVGVHGQNSIRAAFGTPLSPKKPTAKVACPQCTLENSSSATTCRVCDGALSGQLVPCITCHHLAPSLLPTPAPCCRHRPPPPAVGALFFFDFNALKCHFWSTNDIILEYARYDFCGYSRIVRHNVIL